MENGKENGNHYSIMGYVGIMEKSMETNYYRTMGYIGIMEKGMETNYYSIMGYLGRMEQNMKTTIRVDQRLGLRVANSNKV